MPTIAVIIGVCIGAFFVGSLALCYAHVRAVSQKKTRDPSFYSPYSSEVEDALHMDIIPAAPAGSRQPSRSSSPSPSESRIPERNIERGTERFTPASSRNSFDPFERTLL
jgi:hypothetical protein